MHIEYTVIFYGCKNENVKIKNHNIFTYLAQTIDCVYMLEPLVRVPTACVRGLNYTSVLA